MMLGLSEASFKQAISVRASLSMNYPCQEEPISLAG
jgi:hypothetical protein